MDKQARFSSLPGQVQKGLKKAISGDKPFLLSPFTWAAGKAVGKDKVDDFVWRALQKPIADVDIGLGRAAQKGLNKLTGKKGKLFEDKLLLETAKGKGRFTGKKEYMVPSILAPAKKVGKFVVPLAGSIKLEEMYRNAKGKGDMTNKTISKAELQKTAEMLTYLKDQKSSLEKKAKATELLYKQAEMGQIKFPQTLADYQEKVAELLSKDLNIVEEAIKMASSTEDTNSLGNLENPQVKVTSAHDAFANSIIDD